MKSQTAPMAWGFLAGAYFFMVVLIMLACSCAPTGVRSPGQQFSAAVKILTTCTSVPMTVIDMGDGNYLRIPNGEPVVKRFGGTGVIVDAHHLLTAKHVVTCDEGEEMMLTVNTGIGANRDAFVELEFPNNDIARLYVANTMESLMSSIEMGAAPKLGDRVCEASMVPRPTWRCGITQQPDDEGLFTFEMRTEHGNSGSGLYNGRGQLIGIVVQWFPCERMEMCGGKASPIQAWPWLIP